MSYLSLGASSMLAKASLGILPVIKINDNI